MNGLKTLFLFFFFSFVYHVSANIMPCKEASCGPPSLLPVRFPFWLQNLQDPGCGYDSRSSRFNLSCNNRNQTVIRLGQPGSDNRYLFAVTRIDYEKQSIWINDPDDCLPKRFLNQEFGNFTGNTFQPFDRFENYTFLSCPSGAAAGYAKPFLVSCLRNGHGDRAIVALPSVQLHGLRYDPQPISASPAPAPAPPDNRCHEVGVASVPVRWPQPLVADIRLTWRVPDCRKCSQRGGVCRNRSGSGSGIGCSVPLTGPTTGLPRSAKYGIIIGVGIPGLLCIIGLASYICGRVRACGHRRRPYSDRAGLDAPEPAVVLVGLDGPTIESFPKIEIGESKRLPKPNDNTCPICLSEYQPKETLRTIPECNHYFHAACVDEWLKMNATCPLCRNSPESSSRVSPSTSVSFSSSSLSSP